MTGVAQLTMYLDRERVISRWLIYCNGTKTKQAKYYVDIPENVYTSICIQKHSCIVSIEKCLAA